MQRDVGKGKWQATDKRRQAGQGSTGVPGQQQAGQQRHAVKRAAALAAAMRYRLTGQFLPGDMVKLIVGYRTKKHHIGVIVSCGDLIMTVNWVNDRVLTCPKRFLEPYIPEDRTTEV